MPPRILLTPAPINIKITVSFISYTLTPVHITPIYNPFSSLTVPNFFFIIYIPLGQFMEKSFEKKNYVHYLSTYGK